MKLSLAYLGPTGTNSETAALAYADWIANNQPSTTITLCPYPSIALALQSVAKGEIARAIVPIENSIEGSVTVVLDTLWQSAIEVHQELTIPIFHGLLSYSQSLEQIKTVYSHPQALAQCQKWLENFLPQVQLVPTKSTTEGIKLLKEDLTAAAIASPKASELYQVPLLRSDIKDSPDNHTRFWIVSSKISDKPSPMAESYGLAWLPQRGSHLSLAFSLPLNAPGALVKALEIFARREINLSKIESRPTKRSLGEYIFFIDLEGNSHDPEITEALTELSSCTEVLKIFGNYNILDVN